MTLEATDRRPLPSPCPRPQHQRRPAPRNIGFGYVMRLRQASRRPRRREPQGARRPPRAEPPPPRIRVLYRRRQHSWLNVLPRERDGGRPRETSAASVGQPPLIQGRAEELISDWPRHERCRPSGQRGARRRRHQAGPLGRIHRPVPFHVCFIPGVDGVPSPVHDRRDVPDARTVTSRDGAPNSGK